MRDAVRNVMMGHGQFGFNPYLVFAVRRDHLIPDTLESIVRHNAEDLKKELKVKFADEEGCVSFTKKSYHSYCCC